jgi:pimeloyl-ACP methyl ester carboxylesterase
MPEINHGAVGGDGAGPRLAYSQSGCGPDVVLVHGALVDRREMLLSLAPMLAERFRVTAFDRPGHGRSEVAGVTGSPWDQAAQLHAGCRALGLERPVLVGHSFGGAVALAYAQQFPDDLSGVLALAPICFPELRLEHLIFGPRAGPFMGALAARAAGATTDRLVLPTLWRAMFLPQPMPLRYAELFPFEAAAAPERTRHEGQDAALLNVGLARTAWGALTCRTRVHILAGDRDIVVNNRLHGAVMAALLPEGRFEELPGLGHMLHHFAQAPVADAVAELAA